ncbi:hypothetical protein K4B79_12285 [Streptomyces lincolnensis]|uniref:hypothetical protein n=1 Tax=Streptomyces lincolnensis TaxID=1915 RepID=UPI001E58697E|nr:hypothetical protein [Streptomyces lincolnensis]MCD7439003.1 hypothetical protein [Streptomyces lincolnensis]
MTDSTPPEDGEPTSFREKARGWAEKHPRTIRFAKAAGATVGMAVVIMVLTPRGMAEDEAEFARQAEGTAGTEDAESDADSTEETEQRKSPDKHNVVPHKRRLKDGREIDVSGYERGGSSEAEDEDPGEAAA